MFNARTILLPLLVMASACSEKESASSTPPPLEESQTTTEFSAAELPAEVVAVVMAAVPEMKIEGAERKERDGRVYFDVEGARPDGSEVELDVLNENGEYKVVEIQRDIPWSEAPEEARTVAASSSRPFEPVRVIESKQTDGTVIYELFTEGAPGKPALEVRVVDGKAEVLKEEWPH